MQAVDSFRPIMKIEISVVIATYKRPRLLEGTLAALAAQKPTDGFGWEVVVVDNHSQDETGGVVAAFANTVSIPVSCVPESRQGLSRARNQGIAATQGSIIAFVDDDVLPAPDWITQVHQAMHRWDAHGVGGPILPRWEATPPPTWLTSNQHLMDRLAIMDYPNRCVLSYPMRGRPQVWGANMAFRREVFERVGGFDHQRGIVGRKLYRGEEVELINRALQHGCRIVYDPAVTVLHRIGRSRMRKGYFRKLEFDAAEGEVDSSRRGRSMLGAPLWLYPAVVGAFWRWIVLAASRRAGAFDQQLDWFRYMGCLSGYWKADRRQDANSRP
jgi:glycosyltransferase involved in cell wall biosynthesis